MEKIVEFTDDQRAEVLSFLISKREQGFTLDEVIREMEEPLNDIVA